jgi:hypothetical protein
MDWISLAIAIALLVVAVYSGISYFREKKTISRNLFLCKRKNRPARRFFEGSVSWGTSEPW